MFCWPESEGSRGAQEISSCVVKLLSDEANNAKKIRLYSDKCGGQNRNIKMTLALMHYQQNASCAADEIEITFMISGHSWMQNDADFGVIEKKSKQNNRIFTPSDWITIIKNSKKRSRFE